MSFADSYPLTPTTNPYSPSYLPLTPGAANILSTFGEPQESFFISVPAILDFQDTLYQEQLENKEQEYQENDEKVDFLSLAPSNEVDDNVFNVRAESQFSDSPPKIQLVDKIAELRGRMNALNANILKNSGSFFTELPKKMGIPVFGNHEIVAQALHTQSMLVPMLSFYGVTTKDLIGQTFKPRILDIANEVCSMTKNYFVSPPDSPTGFLETDVDFTTPTPGNMVWNIRLTFNGNIFTLLTFRIVAIKNEKNISELESSPYFLHFLLLCFSLLSKAYAKDFNCLCSMPDIDVTLFKELIKDTTSFQSLPAFIKIFLNSLDEPQNDSKKKYMVAALHNLVASCNDTSRTGETLAYKMLFDGDIERGVSGSGAHTFNPIMREITKVIRIFRGLPKLETSTMKELQVSLCGGRMIYKLGDIVKSHVTQVIGVKDEAAAIVATDTFDVPILEMLKPLNLPSDLDYTLTFGGYTPEGDNEAAYEFLKQTQQTYLMFFTLCLQLGIKKIIDTFCTTGAAVHYFLGQPAVVGMSLVGGDFQLSSSRNSCAALPFLDVINISGPTANDILGLFLQQCQPLREGNDAKSSLAPCDLVPKIQSGNYIVKIAHYIFKSGYITISIPANIAANIAIIADRISKYSMTTDQGFSSPVKVLFDIFFTLFSIENFTNRAFVTQKINKELKRIAICGTILFFHFHELLPMYLDGSSQKLHINSMIVTLREVIKYGYNPAVKLLSDQIDNIMTTYASCFSLLLHSYSPGMDVVFYSRNPGVTLPQIGERGEPGLTRLERACMHMIVEPDPSQDVFQAEGLPIDDLTSIITYGLQFLGSIEGTDILPNFLKLKQEVKDKDLQYKARGEFLTSIEAFEIFLEGFIPMLQQPSNLLVFLQPLLTFFYNTEFRFAELMRFQPIVVIDSDKLKDDVKDVPLYSNGLQVSGKHQFGIYAILSIFGVKFKSEFSKISLFTRMLFNALFSRNMDEVCLQLLGVNLSLIDQTKYRRSYENYIKDKVLLEKLVTCRILGETTSQLSEPLLTYYEPGSIQHGIKTYKNPLVDSGEISYSFISTPDGNTILSFQFLNATNLSTLMACNGATATDKNAFIDLYQIDALQPRAYELLIDRLTEKFSNLTEECDKQYKSAKLIPEVHGGRNTKAFRKMVKDYETNEFIEQLVNRFLQDPSYDSNHFLYDLYHNPNNECFKGDAKDEIKFNMLHNNHKNAWFSHLVEMILFFQQLCRQYSQNTELVQFCKNNIKKYSKLLFLLKKYLPLQVIPEPSADMQQAAQQAAIEEASQQVAREEAERQAAMQQAAIQEAARQAAIFQHLPEPVVARNRDRGKDRDRSRGRGTGTSPSPSPSPNRGRSRSPGGSPSGSRQGGGSPKASVTKTKPKTRNNNRYSKNARTRKNKHKPKQHRNRKYKKTTNTKSNRRTKPQSKKNVTFKRRRR
jgi:hypothetical protein